MLNYSTSYNIKRDVESLFLNYRILHSLRFKQQCERERGLPSSLSWRVPAAYEIIMIVQDRSFSIKKG